MTFPTTVDEIPGDVPEKVVAPLAKQVIATPPPVVGAWVYVMGPIGIMAAAGADEMEILEPRVSVA